MAFPHPHTAQPAPPPRPPVTNSKAEGAALLAVVLAVVVVGWLIGLAFPNNKPVKPA